MRFRLSLRQSSRRHSSCQSIDGGEYGFYRSTLTSANTNHSALTVEFIDTLDLEEGRHDVWSETVGTRITVLCSSQHAVTSSQVIQTNSIL